MSGRAPEVEQAFLVTAAATALVGHDFVARVIERLDEAGEKFGRDLPHHLTIADVIGEIREETADVPGWSLMALHLARQRNLPARVQRQLRTRLELCATLAAAIDAQLSKALLELPRERTPA